ncbi:uncharacterized protein LOC133170047 [Syngnathus typhle]|uniref:uncharacterized protein LOC133170047 n=1 Tax=Syngnathus typhle TaxID=161592 RepID=UPI002A6A7628|nr:uncharacterized protein LOC133170047 [Syngnathus typhle]
MKPKRITLFFLLFYFANQDSVQDEVSCREIKGNEGCFHKFDKRCPGGQIVVKEDKTTIGHADFSENPPSFDIYKTFARCINESGIVINYGSNISTEYHNCNGMPEDSTDFYCTHDTSMNGAPGTSSKPNVTHPIANDTSKNVMVGVGVVVVVVVVVLCIRKYMREKEKKKMLPKAVHSDPLLPRATADQPTETTSAIELLSEDDEAAVVNGLS